MRLTLLPGWTMTGAPRIAVARAWIRQLLGIPLYRNAFYLMLNSAIVAFTGFVFWATAARLYPAEGVGFASAAIAAMTLLALLATLGLDYGLVRFLPGRGEGAADVLDSCFTVGGLVAAVFSLVFVAGLNVWSPALLLLQEHPVYFAGFVVFTVASTLMMLVIRTFVAKRRAGFTLVQGVLFGVVRFIPLVFLATYFRTFGIFAAWGLTMLLAVIVCMLLVLPRVQAGYRPRPAISRRAMGEVIRFSFANYAANLSWAVPGLILPIMVVNRLGAEANAYFYVAWATASILFGIPMAASLSLFAEGSYGRQKLTRDSVRSLKLIFAALVPAVVLMVVLGDKLLLIFGTAYSESGIRLLQVLAASALPLGVNQVYFSIKRVELKMRSVVWLSVLVAVLTLSLSWFLLPQMGIWGAGVAWLSANGLVAVVAVRGLLQPIWSSRRRRQVSSSAPGDRLAEANET